MNLAFRITLLLPLLACAHSAPAAASGVTQPRAAGAFTRIDLRGPVDITVHEGRLLAMSVTTEGIAPNKVRTRVEGDALVVDLEEPSCTGGGVCVQRQSAKLDVDLPELDGLEIDGSGDVTILGDHAHAKFDVDIQGSGDVHFAGTADLLHCRIEGSGDVTLKGSAKRLEADVHGSGNIDARALAANGAAFVLDGSGDVSADLHGGDTSIRLHGSGGLRYTGEAHITSLDISGSGEVRHE